MKEFSEGPLFTPTEQSRLVGERKRLEKLNLAKREMLPMPDNEETLTPEVVHVKSAEAVVNMKRRVSILYQTDPQYKDTSEEPLTKSQKVLVVAGLTLAGAVTGAALSIVIPLLFGLTAANAGIAVTLGAVGGVCAGIAAAQKFIQTRTPFKNS